MSQWTLAGINFDHSHMGDNLRAAHEHPDVEIVALSDESAARMDAAAREFSVPPERCFTDYRSCLETTRPDIVLLCPATARHGEWTEKVAPYGPHIIMEKPFAASLAEADAMVRAMEASGKLLAINWPLVWYPSHRTAKRLVDEGAIGEVKEVHYYDGNRGPLWHVEGKTETTAEYVEREKPNTWFYKRAHGGGSLLDYLGYGVTLGTWFKNGEVPVEVTSIVDDPPGLEVDEHSVTVARYSSGLSKFETRWGTFTDPWTHQPQPKCGFVLVGTEGTISSYDYEPTIHLQTRSQPTATSIAVDQVESPYQNPVQNVVHCLETGAALEGPLSPDIARIGQQMVDTAVISAREKRTVSLLP